MGEKFFNKIREQLEVVETQNVVFWGASLFLEEFIKNNNLEKYNILGIIDNDCNKWGKFIGKYQILPPLKICKLQPIYIISTIKNRAKDAYYGILERINSLDCNQVCVFPNIFKEDPIKKISSTNRIYLIKNGVREQIEKLSGFRITFAGENNTIEFGADPLPKFENCNLKVVGNNNYFKIDSSEHIIKELECFLEGDFAKLLINKNFSMAGGIIKLHSNFRIDIGEDCMFSSNIYIRSSDGHTIIDNTTKEIINESKERTLSIGNHVWLGNGVSVLKNSKISDNSVVGKNTIVTKKFETPNIILVGNPAKIIKNNINWDRRDLELYKKEVLNA